MCLSIYCCINGCSCEIFCCLGFLRLVCDRHETKKFAINMSEWMHATWKGGGGDYIVSDKIMVLAADNDTLSAFHQRKRAR